MPDRFQAQDTPVPRWFLEAVAPRIREMCELQVMLTVFRLLADEGALTAPIAERRLFDDPLLADALKLDGAVRLPDDSIRRGIELSVARDSLLKFSVTNDNDPDPISWLLLATPENRLSLERYRSGALRLPETAGSDGGAHRVERTRPGVFQLYEQNIGLVTPIVADRLVEALERYPEPWIEDAIAAAVSYNRRNWRYIQRILETWATEGRSNETNRRHQSGSGDFDPERHLSGEYAAIFRRRRRE
jgi:DNA replication protein